MAKVTSKPDKDNPGGLFIPGGVITGMGVGILTSNVAAGMFIGLGVGFVLFALTLMFYKAK